MLIRSQDKEILLNFNRCKGIFTTYCSNGYGSVRNVNIKYSDKDSDITIGRYSTLEKAFKVLDMISESYKECNMVFQMPLDEEVLNEETK